MTVTPIRPDRTPCEVCGAAAVRLVRVRLADGVIVGWLCDEHARDVEQMR